MVDLVNPLNPRQRFRITDRVRLEVDVPPATPPATGTVLRNLALNPSGDTGSWWWFAPQADVGISTALGKRGIRLKQNIGGVVQSAITGWMPVKAGEFVFTRWLLLAISTGRQGSIQLEFADYSQNPLWASDPSYTGDPPYPGIAVNTVANTVAYGAPYKVPANAAWVRAYLTLTNTDGTAAAVGNSMVFRDFMLGVKATPAHPSVFNYNPNPNFELSTAGYAVTTIDTGAGAIARTQAVGGVDGDYALRITLTATGSLDVYTDIPLLGDFAGGSLAQIQNSLRGTAARNISLGYRWLRDDGSIIASGFPTNANASTTAYGSLSANIGAAPAGATKLRHFLRINGGVVGDVFYFDAFQLARGAGVSAYRSGNSTDTTDANYEWAGAANNSVTWRLTADAAGDTPTFLEPGNWMNIINDSASILIRRSPLGAQTLEASIVNPALDPAVDPAQVLDVGRDVRVTALVDYTSTATSVWEPIYVGTISPDSRTNYYPAKGRNVPDRLEVKIIANGNVARAANITSRNGIAGVASSTVLLDGAPFPYRCNGINYQLFTAGATPTAASSDPDAKLLDQLILTRDSAQAFGWFDRTGTFQMWDREQIPGGLVLEGRYNTNATPASLSNATTTRVGLTDKLTATAAGDVVVTYVAPVQPGKRYYTWLQVKAETTGRVTRSRIEWLGADAAARILDSATEQATTITAGYDLPNGTDVNTGYTLSPPTVPFIYEAPPGASYVRQRLTIAGCAAGEIHWVNGGLYTQEEPITFTDDPDAWPPNRWLNSYTDADVSFGAADSMVNTVNVTFLHYDAPTDTTTEVAYGPYVYPTAGQDGEFSATYKVQGGTETDARFKVFATTIHTSQARPQRSARSMTVFVENVDAIRHAVIVDHCSLVLVNRADLVDAAHRVVDIEHAIDAESWQTTYGLDIPAAVPLPLSR